MRSGEQVRGIVAWADIRNDLQELGGPDLASFVSPDSQPRPQLRSVPGVQLRYLHGGLLDEGAEATCRWLGEGTWRATLLSADLRSCTRVYRKPL